MNNVIYWIAFNQIPGIGAVRFQLLLDFFDQDVEAAWEADSWKLAEAGLDQRTIKSFLKYRPQIDLDQEMSKIEQYGITVLTWDDPNYPRLLREAEKAPPVLYVRGELTLEDELAVAIVGTRKVSPYGRRVTEMLATGLAEAGITVVSGLALGVDGIAHHNVLQTGGRTIAVLANGVEQAYPAKHRKMAEAIVSRGQGALVSDYPVGTRPEAKNFPPRNRIISALSIGVIVVEAGERSGALITARYAGKQGRDVFAVPGSILSPTSKGTNRLIVEGAIPVLSVESILQRLNIQMVEPQRAVRQVMATTPEEEQLLKILYTTPRHIDEIGQECGLPTAKLSSTLAMLELKGFVRQVGLMNYVKC